MLLKNEDEIVLNICDSILNCAKENKEIEIQYYLNNVRILSRRKLNYCELENKDNDNGLESRKDYVNAAGIIASTVNVERDQGKIKVVFNVSEREKSKTKISWEYADAINTITRKQYFKEDFDTVKSFAKAAGLKAPFISKLRSASNFRKKNKDNPFLQKCDIYKAARLNSLGYELEVFAEMLGGYEEIVKMDQRQLENEVAEFRRDAFSPF